jgi:hypothetical protein
VPVFLKRLAAPEWPFIFGIALLNQTPARSLPLFGCLQRGYAANKGAICARKEG